MGISYDIIDSQSNQTIASFGLKWLQEYTNFNTPNLDRSDMIEYCEQEIDKLKMEFDDFQSKSFHELKNNLISKIYPAENENQLKDILSYYLDEMSPNSDLDQIYYLDTMIKNFKSFQTFLIPYSPEFRGEISY